MREYDWDREEYIPLEKGQGNICERCGREHAKVYVVRDALTEKEHHVGSTCSKKLFGWEPDSDVLKAANKAMRDEQKKTAYQKYLREQAQPLADVILSMEVPPMVQTGMHNNDIYGPNTYDYSCGKARINTLNKTLTGADRIHLKNEWWKRQIDETVQKLGLPHYKQEWKLTDAVRELVLAEEVR